MNSRPLLSRIGIALLVLTIGASRPLFAQTLRIYHIDVEQADAALLVMPNGKTLLIDSGKNNMGQRIRNAMQQAGVTQIDAFIDSHYHEDHYGGIDDLVDMGVLESYDRGDKACCLSTKKKNEPTFKDYMRTVADPQTTDQDGTIEIAVNGATGSYTVRYAARIRG